MLAPRLDGWNLDQGHIILISAGCEKKARDRKHLEELVVPFVLICGISVASSCRPPSVILDALKDRLTSLVGECSAITSLFRLRF